MPNRDFFTNGETMVYVRGGAHLAEGLGGDRTELGLALDDVKVIPRYIHRDVHVDDFGPEVPAEVLSMIAEVNVRMTLSHYDNLMLRVLQAGSLGSFNNDGTMPPAGTPLGQNKELFSSGCNYFSMELASPQANDPITFRTGYLAMQPVVLPLGTTYSKVDLNWRFIPYKPIPSTGAGGEIKSSGAILWYRGVIP